MSTSEQNNENADELLKAAKHISDLKIRLQMAEELVMDVFRRNLTGKIDENIYFLRRQRAQFFPEDYFSDSMWDIMLELYHAHGENRWLAVSDIGFSSNIAQTTMLRYLAQLESDGHIIRKNDETDKRRQLIKMNTHCKDMMTELFDDFTQKLLSQGRYRNKGNLRGLAA